MSAYDADERVARFILATYRKPGEADNEHLAACPEAHVEDPDAYNGTYGCDTGCDYARFEAIIACPHGERADFNWGDFGDVASILEELDRQTAEGGAP
ncbi:hypothetical protein [Streptosporangium sp. CA-115845]|uniref:hypothetical protein n=1 Tax=Streptosporangium sp. CA-115845 TaxID=3240071 RepID=UPI003D8A8BF3